MNYTNNSTESRKNKHLSLLRFKDGFSVYKKAKELNHRINKYYLYNTEIKQRKKIKGYLHRKWKSDTVIDERAINDCVLLNLGY